MGKSSRQYLHCVGLTWNPENVWWIKCSAAAFYTRKCRSCWAWNSHAVFLSTTKMALSPDPWRWKNKDFPCFSTTFPSGSLVRPFHVWTITRPEYWHGLYTLLAVYAVSCQQYSIRSFNGHSFSVLLTVHWQYCTYVVRYIMYGRWRKAILFTRAQLIRFCRHAWIINKETFLLILESHRSGRKKFYNIT